MSACHLDSITRLVGRSGRGRPARLLCSLLLLAASAVPIAAIAAAGAQPEPGPEPAFTEGPAHPAEPSRMEIPALKSAYLECDRVASERLLAWHEAMRCSQVSEALLARGFNRDFEQLLAWWNAEKATRQGTQASTR